MLKITPPYCSDCSGEWTKVTQIVTAYSQLFRPNGAGYEWEGDSDVDWDSQRDMELADGRLEAWCENDHDHHITVKDMASELVRIPR